MRLIKSDCCRVSAEMAISLIKSDRGTGGVLIDLGYEIDYLTKYFFASSIIHINILVQ